MICTYWIQYIYTTANVRFRQESPKTHGFSFHFCLFIVRNFEERSGICFYSSWFVWGCTPYICVIITWFFLLCVWKTLVFRKRNVSREQRHEFTHFIFYWKIARSFHPQSNRKLDKFTNSVCTHSVNIQYTHFIQHVDKLKKLYIISSIICLIAVHRGEAKFNKIQSNCLFYLLIFNENHNQFLIKRKFKNVRL